MKYSVQAGCQSYSLASTTISVQPVSCDAARQKSFFVIRFVNDLVPNPTNPPCLPFPMPSETRVPLRDLKKCRKMAAEGPGNIVVSQVKIVVRRDGSARVRHQSNLSPVRVAVSRPGLGRVRVLGAVVDDHNLPLALLVGLYSGVVAIFKKNVSI